jgi:hypothetical protein
VREGRQRHDAAGCRWRPQGCCRGDMTPTAGWQAGCMMQLHAHVMCHVTCYLTSSICRSPSKKSQHSVDNALRRSASMARGFLRQPFCCCLIQTSFAAALLLGSSQDSWSAACSSHNSGAHTSVWWNMGGLGFRRWICTWGLAPLHTQVHCHLTQCTPHP